MKVKELVPMLEKGLTIAAEPNRGITPTTDEKHVGIEIECFMPSKYSREFLGVLFAMNKLDEHIDLGYDGSIRADSGHFAYEIRFIAKESQFEAKLKVLGKILKAVEARTNFSCGLHVHLDMRAYNAKRLDVIFHNFLKTQDYLFTKVAPNRSALATCRKVPERYVFEGQGPALQDVKYENWVYQAQHHDAINISSYGRHQTFEIRAHHGTTNTDEITKWVKMLLTIRNHKSKLTSKVGSDKQFKEVFLNGAA